MADFASQARDPFSNWTEESEDPTTTTSRTNSREWSAEDEQPTSSQSRDHCAVTEQV